MQFDFNVSRCWTEVVINTIVTELQFCGAHKASAVAAPWIITFTDALYREGNAFGDTVKSEVTCDFASAFASGFKIGAFERRGWVFLNVQEITAFQVLITLSMV